MNINTLTIKAQEALQAALNLARERGQQAVEPLHLLAVLIREDDSPWTSPRTSATNTLRSNTFCWVSWPNADRRPTSSSAAAQRRHREGASRSDPYLPQGCDGRFADLRTAVRRAGQVRRHRRQARLRRAGPARDARGVPHAQAPQQLLPRKVSGHGHCGLQERVRPHLSGR